MVYLESQHELNLIEKEINQAANNQENEIKSLNEKFTNIEELLELERKEKVILSEIMRKELKLFENLMEIEANTDKFYSLKVDLAKEKKLREDASYQFFDSIEEKVNEIKDEIDWLNKSRVESHEKLAKKIGQEINSFHQLLSEVRTKRKQMHDSMFVMINDMQKAIVNELANEKKEREETEEQLIKLLEDMWVRMERSIMN